MREPRWAGYWRALEGAADPASRLELDEELCREDSAFSAFLEDLGPDAAEREVARALALAVPTQSRIAPLSEQEAERVFSHVARAVREKNAHKASRGVSVRRRPVAALFVGASAALLAVVLVLSFGRDDERIKGEPDIASSHVRLVFHVASSEPGRPLVMDRGVPGGEYRQSDDILLRFGIDAPGHVCLVHERPNRERVVLVDPSARRAAGWHDWRAKGSLQGLRLQGDVGHNAFYALWQKDPFDCLKTLAAALSSRSVSETLVDSVSIEVLP